MVLQKTEMLRRASGGPAVWRFLKGKSVASMARLSTSISIARLSPMEGAGHERSGRDVHEPECEHIAETIWEVP